MLSTSKLCCYLSIPSQAEICTPCISCACLLGLDLRIGLKALLYNINIKIDDLTRMCSIIRTVFKAYHIYLFLLPVCVDTVHRLDNQALTTLCAEFNPQCVTSSFAC